MVRRVSGTLTRLDQLIAQGIAAQNAQRFGEAERAYRAALQLDPSDPRALTLLGTLAGIAGRFVIALDFFSRALQRDPTNADLHHNIGETYRQLGDVGQALPAFNRAIELRPAHFEAYRSAADAAIAAAAQAGTASGGTHARELRRIAARYLVKLGQKRYEERLGGIEPIFREAVALDPDSASALVALGSLLQETGYPTEAVAVLRRALALDERNVQAWNNLGNAFFSLQQWSETEDALRRAVALDPHSAMARQNLVSTGLMGLLYDDRATPEEIYERHRAWGSATSAELDANAMRAPPFANARDPERRLRIAYLSGDFRGHSVGYFIAPLLRHHDPAQVEVYCYAEIDRPDAVTASLRQNRATWRDTMKLSDDALRAQLRADAIDIAIDLAGHTARNRLRALALRAAPVAVTWLGYPATTGLPAIDWRITDAIADPPGAERLYTEKLLRLPDGFLCYEARDADVPTIAPPPAAATGRVTFGSFNNPQKLSPATIGVWASILTQVPDSRLLLKAPTYVDPGIQRYFLALFDAQGIGAERVVFRGFAPTAMAHLATYGEIDIALDPFPYNGTTTSCEAMWMGVPVVTLIGDRHTGRVGLDLLTRLDLSDLAAPDPAAYVATAAALARDLPRLRALRRTLRDRMRASSLCDGPGFARAFEQALRLMWQRWCAV